MPRTDSARETLLVLDDTPEIAELIGDLGRSAGLEPVVTTEIDAFNEALERTAPDIIALDLQMPGTDGIEVLRMLASLGCQARILLISGVDSATVMSAERLGRQMRLNMLGVLCKPFEPEALVAKFASARALTSDLTGADLEAAMQSASLVLRYQPVVRRITAGTWHAESVEALPRWQHAELGVLTPAEFLPLLGSGRGEMMRQFTDYVLQQSIEQLRQWQANGLHLGLRVNISAAFICDTKFPDRLSLLCRELDVDPNLLTLELAHTASLISSLDASEILTRLRLNGVRLSLDDFGGSGVELKALYSLPVCEAKVDPSITADLATEGGAPIIYEALIKMARRLDIECCAEGVESEDQFSILDDLGCELVQGFYIGTPMSARKIPSAMQNWTATDAARAAS